MWQLCRHSSKDNFRGKWKRVERGEREKERERERKRETVTERDNTEARY